MSRSIKELVVTSFLTSLHTNEKQTIIGLGDPTHTAPESAIPKCQTYIQVGDSNECSLPPNCNIPLFKI